MSKALQEKIDRLFDATKDLRSLEEIKVHCETFNEWVNTSTSYSHATLGTKLSAYGFYNKFNGIPLEQEKNAVSIAKHNPDGSVKGYELKHYATVLCGLNQEQWNDRNQTTRAIDRVQNGTEIDPDRYLEIAGVLLGSTNPHELAVGLIAVSGRRPHEILARAKFTAIKDKPYHVLFSGQGKKRGQTPTFEIPTLYPADCVIKALARLRKDPSIQILLKKVAAQFPDSITRQNIEIDNHRGQSLRRVARAYFGDTGDKNPVLNFRYEEKNSNNKALRAAYSILCTERDCKGGYGVKIFHASRILGHFTPEKPDDRLLTKIATTINYSDYFTQKPVKFPTMPEQKQKMKLTQVRATQTDFNTIVKLQKELELPNQQSVIEHLLKPQNHNEQLERRLMEAQQKIADMQKTITNYETQLNQVQQAQQAQQVMNRQPQPQITEAQNHQDSRVDKLEAQMGQMMEMMQQIISGTSSTKSQSEESTAAPVATVAAIKPTSKQKNDWESIPNEQLKNMKANGAVEEKIYRAFRAIASYNDTAPSNEDRWYIGSTTLSQVSGCNRQNIGDWVKAHQMTVDDHNNKYGLGQYHNKRHKGIEITDLIKLWDSVLAEQSSEQLAEQ